MEDEFHPVVHHRHWSGATDCAQRRFFRDDEKSPLIVTYATSPRDRESYLSLARLRESGLAPHEVEKKALKRWTDYTPVPKWQNVDFEEGPQEALAVRNGNYTFSNVLLSRGHLKGLHQHFDIQNLGLIIPKRDTVIVHPDFLALAKLGRTLFAKANEQNLGFSPLCFASYEAQVLGYVTPEYEKEHAPVPEAPEVEMIELSKAVITPALVMVGADGRSSAPQVEKFAEGESMIGKACREMVDGHLEDVREMAAENLSQVRLLALLGQALYRFDQRSDARRSARIREITTAIAEHVAANSGGGTFRMESVRGKHEQSSLGVVKEVLA